MVLVKVLIVLLLLTQGSWSQSCPTELDADVIIIGAGMSGVAAANRLEELNITNVLIVEGSSQVGGRVTSTMFAGVRVSLGATWIQGTDPNAPMLHPLFQLVQSCPSVQDMRGVYTDYSNVTVFNAEGGPNKRELRYDDLESAYDALELTECVSLRTALNNSGWSPITPADNWIEWFCNDYCTGESPDDASVIIEIDQTPTSFVATEGSYGEDYFVTDDRGFQTIIECLANKTVVDGEARLLLNTVVNNVDLSNDNCVCVETDTNNQYCGKYAISTVSIGVLQANDQPTFTPALPIWKQDVIEQFGMARYIHIMMEFNEVFWNDSQHIGYIANERGQYPLFINLHRIFPEGPRVLMAVLTGDQVTRVHAQSEEQTISELEQLLSIIYPDANTTVIDYIIPNWIDNPLVRGSYTYLPVDFKQKYFALLAAPVGNLYFSGEATSMEYNGYVHSAYFAGRASADSVAAKLNSGTVMRGSYLLTALIAILVVLH